MAKHLARLTFGALLLVGTTRGWAAPGDLDLNFGSGGRFDSYGVTLLLLPDDRLVTAGESVARYDADGRIDPTYGDGGVALIPLSDGTDRFYTQYTAATPDGGVLVAGFLIAADSSKHSPEVVMRLDRDGHVVTSFGGHGDGFYRLPAVAGPPGVLLSRLTAIAVDPVGHIVLAERSWTRAQCDGPDMVVRLASNGVVDATFGTDGSARLGLCGSERLFGVRNDGSIVVGGRGGIVGLDETGNLDPIFGVAGHVAHGLPDEGPGGRMLPDGGILIVGHDGADAVLTRVDRNGQFDADFGAGTGSVRLDLGAAFLGLTGSRSSVHDFVLTPDAAHVYLQLTVLHADGTAACGGGIARILLDGTPDISFGKQGLTCLDYGSFWLKRLVGSQRNGSPLFEVWYDAFYRLLMDATPSPGMLTKVCNGPIVHVGEADRTVAVSVVRTAGNDGPVSLDYATGQRGELYYNDDIVDHLTTADADYQSTSGRLDWADEDDGVREINITILDDELVETDEYFSIQLSNLRGRALTPPDGDTRCFHVGIDDDDDGVPSPSPAPPPAPQPTLDSGGGGSFSWPTLLLAAGLLLGHRRRRRLITTSPLDAAGVQPGAA